MNAVRASYVACRRITRQASSTFYLASLLFGADARRDIQVLYAFCRVADDIADSPALTRTAKFRALAEMERALTDPSYLPRQADIWPAVRAVIARYSLPLEQMQAVLDGVKTDISFRQPEDLADLDHYSYLVAGVVGELSARILGAHAKKTFTAAKNLGIAMQYTNIVRDVAADLELDRIYIPKSVMRKHGVTLAMLRQRVMNPQIRAAVTELADRSELFYVKSEPGIADLATAYQQPVRCAAGLYWAILERVKQKQYNVFVGRTRLTRLEKLRLVWDICQTPLGAPLMKGNLAQHGHGSESKVTR